MALSNFNNFQIYQQSLMDLLDGEFCAQYVSSSNKQATTSIALARMRGAMDMLRLLVDTVEVNTDVDTINLTESCNRARDFYRDTERCNSKNIVIRQFLIFNAKEQEDKSIHRAEKKSIREYFENLRVAKCVSLIPYIMLDNAIKYTPEGFYNDINKNDHLLQIQFEFSKNDDGSMVMTMSNVGPKYSEEELTHLCDRGYRNKAAAIHTSDGFGLGLYFIKSIMGESRVRCFSDDTTLFEKNGIEYSRFYIDVIFDNEFGHVDKIDAAEQVFLHEYNKILEVLNQCVEELNGTRVINNIDRIAQDKGLDKDELLQFLDTLTDRYRDYKLAVMCYVYATDKRFVNVNGAINVPIKLHEIFGNANMYYQEKIEEQDIAIKKEVNENNRFIDISNNNWSNITILEVKAISWLRDIPFLLYSLIEKVANKNVDFRFTPLGRYISIDVFITLKNNSGIEDKESHVYTVRHLIKYILEGADMLQKEKIDGDTYVLTFICEKNTLQNS